MATNVNPEREQIADILWHSHWRGTQEFDHENPKVRDLYLHYADLLIEHGVGFMNGSSSEQA